MILTCTTKEISEETAIAPDDVIDSLRSELMLEKTYSGKHYIVLRERDESSYHTQLSSSKKYIDTDPKKLKWCSNMYLIPVIGQKCSILPLRTPSSQPQQHDVPIYSHLNIVRR